MQFTIDIGDWSGDGHRQVQTFTIETNAPSMETVQEALAAVPGSGVMPPEFLCEEYEDSRISKLAYEEAVAAGWQPSKYVLPCSNGSFELGVEEYLDYTLWYMKWACEGRYDFRLVELPRLEGSFGYGLFRG